MFLKAVALNWKVLYLRLNLQFVFVTIFLTYLTAVHNMDVAKVWLAHVPTVTCAWLMDLLTVLTIRIFPDRVAWMWHLLVHLLLQLAVYQNLCQMMVKSPINQRDFHFRNAISYSRKIFMEHAFSLALSRINSVATGRMVILGKLVNSVSINPFLSTTNLWKWFAK